MGVTTPQYTAKWEEIGEPPNVTLIARCPFCNVIVTQRSWMGFVQAEIDAELDSMKAIRLKESSVDREVFWEHLTNVHPEHFQ